MPASPLSNVNPGVLKLGGVALAAYVLGRMKKGRAAIGLAMWAAGMKMDPKELLRQGVVNLASSDQGKELIAQLRGPAMEAGRKAAAAAPAPGRPPAALPPRAPPRLALLGPPPRVVAVSRAPVPPPGPPPRPR